MKYYVYIIINNKDNKSVTYVGYTNNIEKRLFFHNTSKGAKFTRGRKWTLIYKKCYKTKSLAMKNEYLLKNDRVKRKMIKDKYLSKK
jgi:putative endonuclease